MWEQFDNVLLKFGFSKSILRIGFGNIRDINNEMLSWDPIQFGASFSDCESIEKDFDFDLDLDLEFSIFCSISFASSVASV